MIGKKILNYEIKSLLGEGGMGNVYLAEHTQLGRKVAIKSLHQQLVKHEGIRSRFKKEAETMARFQHPKIVALIDYSEEDDGLYLIMEYIDGSPLDEYIKKKSGPIPESKAVPMMEQILDAFAYAHANGVVHRDIKPSNIIITKNDEIKILDFGIAKVLSEAGNKLTKTGTQMGTVFYMSPEQVQGKDIDIRSDIYSLGVTFFQMLTGASPYDNLTTEFEIYSKIVSEQLPRASQIYPGVPAYLDNIILKATEKNKEDRFQTCEEFASALSQKKNVIVSAPTAPKTSNPRHADKTVINSPAKTHSLKNAWIALAVCSAISISLGIWSNYYQSHYSYNYDDYNDDSETSSDTAATDAYYDDSYTVDTAAPSDYNYDEVPSTEYQNNEYYDENNYATDSAY